MSMDLNDRSRQILQWIVEGYLSTGGPVGSRAIADKLEGRISSATIRNVMMDLADAELIYSPHTSAGRQPTQAGLRFYVDELMERRELSPQERRQIERGFTQSGSNLRDIYDGASTALSGLASCVGLVMAPKIHKPIRQIQFLPLERGQVLGIIVLNDGSVENRVITLPAPVPRAMLDQAAEYINNRIANRTVNEVRDILKSEIGRSEDQLQKLTATLIEQGIVMPMSSSDDDYIFVRGQTHLLTEENAVSEIRDLLIALEEHKNMLDIMNAVSEADGVHIFIGSENPVFGKRTGWSTIIRPYHDQAGRIIGATGVIGPTRLNYKQIVPIVDYTAQMMERLLGLEKR